jgi:hypothetical protein
MAIKYRFIVAIEWKKSEGSRASGLGDVHEKITKWRIFDVFATL